ncbi:MAG TPA: hypothetical protein PKU97_24625, partial [Kofleriaceae bacterium]|nr:hypothetical protein [Kofleriaceae bacterium]
MSVMPSTAGPKRAVMEDPAATYRQRIAGELVMRETIDRRHGNVVAGRIVCLLATVGAAALAPRTAAAGVAAVGAAVFVVLTVVIARLEEQLRLRQRTLAYYEQGLARVEERWMDTAPRGEAYAD